MAKQQMPTNDVAQERAIAENKIALADMVKNLEKNEDFTKLCEFYIKDEPVRLTGLLAVEQFSSAEERAKIYDMLMGISQFNLFLIRTRQMGEIAKKALEDMDNASNEMDSATEM